MFKFLISKKSQISRIQLELWKFYKKPEIFIMTVAGDSQNFFVICKIAAIYFGNFSTVQAFELASNQTLCSISTRDVDKNQSKPF